MGNTFSKKQQPDSSRVQQNNSSNGRPMSIWDYNAFENPVSASDNTGLYKKIYLASFYNSQSGCFYGHLFIVGFQRVDGDNEPREYRHSFLFFKFDAKPTEITIQRQTNGELKISFIGDGNIILFDQVWFSSEYELSEDGSDLISIVKKKMIYNVSSNVQPLSVDSQTDGSATLAPEVFEGDNGAEAPVSQTNVQPLSVDSQTDGSARPVEVSKSNPVLALLNQMVSQRHVVSALETASIILQSGIVSASEALLPILQSGIVSASEALLPILQSGIVSASHSPATVLQSGIVSASHSPATGIQINRDIIFFATVYVNHQNLLVGISIPSTVIESMIKFFRAVGPNVLGTVSRLMNQLTGLLQLDYKPSETALVLSDALCGNGRTFLTSMFHQMMRFISLLERQASSEDATDWEIVECVKPSVEVVSRNMSASSSLDLVSRKSPEQLCSRQDFDTETKLAGVNVVNNFSDTKHRYTVFSKCISFSIGSDTFFVEFGISFNLINKIIVYEMMKGVVLIVIHTFDNQVYLSGHSRTSTSAVFPKAQITSYSFSGQPNLFESIEFDSSNSLRFQINMTNCKKFFAIDDQDGSIRQLDCQWNNKL
jgi:hypothetical protein